MRLSPWFQVGKDGLPHRSGRYQFELWLRDDTAFHTHAEFAGGKFIVTDDGRLIELTREDYWRGVLK